MSVEFEAFRSIARLSRDVVVTEKIDGTNAQVYVGDDGEVLAGSRSRWLGTDKNADDNFGFGRWVKEHEDELRTGLGPGRHYGEWWGAGIQRRYGLSEKRFSLFNVHRWADDAVSKNPQVTFTPRPACCSVVPVLYRGPFSTTMIDDVLYALAERGSSAAPGFMTPEGIVVYHEAAKTLFKKTLDGDGHKSEKK